MTPALVAFGVVFLAELGDKTQLVVLTLGTRYKAAPALGALGLAILVLQGISVTAGAAVGEALPDDAVTIAAGLLFCTFAVVTWRTAAHADEGAPPAAGRGVWGLALAFFLAELGDKTMITTASLAADRGALGVYAGSVVAMLASTVLALVAGNAIAQRVPASTMGRIGAVAFAAVGVFTLLSAL